MVKTRLALIEKGLAKPKRIVHTNRAMTMTRENNFRWDAPITLLSWKWVGGSTGIIFVVCLLCQWECGWGDINLCPDDLPEVISLC